MEKIKILHTADLHIGKADSFLGKLAEQRRMETLLTFERIMDIAKENSVNMVALAGDVFDSNLVEEKFVTAFLNKIKECSEIKVVYSAGNHDPLNIQSPFKKYQLPENLYVLDTFDQCITFEDLKLKVYGRSFENSSLKGEEEFTIQADPNYINLLVQHGELKSDLNSQYNAITPNFVKKCKMDYIALGHIHQKSDIGKIGNTYFAYCGCPEGQGFDETDVKGVYLGEIGKGFCDLKFIETGKRKHICENINIQNCKSNTDIYNLILEKLESLYSENYCENLYKIILQGEINPQNEPNTEELTLRLSQKLFFVKIKDNTEYSLDLDYISKDKNLKGIFVKNMLCKIDNANEEELPVLKQALKLGLKAFSGEVKFNED